MTEHVFHILCNIDDVDPGVVGAMEALAPHMPMAVATRVQFALSEALQNHVDHASDLAPDADMEVRAELSKDRVILEIFDPSGAMPFDLRAHVRPLDEIDAMAESGRGLAIISECADTIDYGEHDGRHRLRLEFAYDPDDI